MTDIRLTDRLTALLWPEGGGIDKPQVYAVMDGARDSAIEPLIRTSGLEYACLYRGELSLRLRRAAPYLVHLAPDARLTPQLLERAWGASWGFFTRVSPDVTLTLQRRHFRKLLRVQDEAKRKLLFRYYDPRVLRVYLPTCTREELVQFFGPVRYMIVESADAELALAFRHDASGLHCDEIPV